MMSGLAREPECANHSVGPVSIWQKKVLECLPQTSYALEPGTAFLYSNIGYATLGVAIERAAGKPYIDLVSDSIFKRLGMTSSAFVPTSAMDKTLAHGYIRHFLRVAVPGGVVAFQLPRGPVGPAGAVMRSLPPAALDRLRAGMQMHGADPAAVTRTVAAAGGVTVSIEEDASAGPRWRSHLYLVRAGEPAHPAAGRRAAPGADRAVPDPR